MEHNTQPKPKMKITMSNVKVGIKTYTTKLKKSSLYLPLSKLHAPSPVKSFVTESYSVWSKYSEVCRNLSPWYSHRAKRTKTNIRPLSVPLCDHFFFLLFLSFFLSFFCFLSFILSFLLKTCLYMIKPNKSKTVFIYVRCNWCDWGVTLLPFKCPIYHILRTYFRQQFRSINLQLYTTICLFSCWNTTHNCVKNHFPLHQVRRLAHQHTLSTIVKIVLFINIVIVNIVVIIIKIVTIISLSMTLLLHKIVQKECIKFQIIK